jgi:hypothetical protein
VEVPAMVGNKARDKASVRVEDEGNECKKAV